MSLYSRIKFIEIWSIHHTYYRLSLIPYAYADTKDRQPLRIAVCTIKRIYYPFPICTFIYMLACLLAYYRMPGIFLAYLFYKIQL